MTDFKEIQLSRIELNTGQIDGLPSNPRQITEGRLKLLKDNIKNYPQMLELRGLMVYPHKSKYVIIGGNMRFRAMKELGMKTAPCVVIPKETSVEDLQAYTMLDNNGFGEWDYDKLANEWEEKKLLAWGVDLPVFINEDEDEDDKKDENKDDDNKLVYEINFSDKHEKDEFTYLLSELNSELKAFDSESERLVAALKFWRINHS